MLMSDGIQDAEGPVIMERLAALHPPEPEPGCQPRNADCQKLEFDMTEEGIRECLIDIRKAINFFPKESAHGPSGLRPDNLKEMLPDPLGTQSDTLLGTIVNFIRMCLAEGIPKNVAFVSMGAWLTLLRKPGQANTSQDELGNEIQNAEPTKDGTRPISAGECLRRLVGKFLMRHPTIRDRMKEIQPLQCGVGVPAACELIAMGLQQEVNYLHGQKDNKMGCPAS